MYMNRSCPQLWVLIGSRSRLTVVKSLLLPPLQSVFVGGAPTRICSLMFTLSDPECFLLSAEEGILIKGYAFRCLSCCSVCP